MLKLELKSGVSLTFKSKSKQFNVWLPRENHEWFSNFLKTHYAGKTNSDRFKNFVQALKTRPQVQQLPRATKKWQCLRELKFSEAQREYFCSRCKTHNPTEYEACQEVNEEAQK